MIPGMAPLRLFRRIPVPMHLDHPCWRGSRCLKPCMVLHRSEELARAAAARFFRAAPVERGAPVEDPWSDPQLVACHDGGTLNDLSGPLRPGAGLDLSGGQIDSADFSSLTVGRGG